MQRLCPHPSNTTRQIIYCDILLGNKKKVLLYMDRDVVTEAKDIGLNLSKTCENALKNTIKRLTNTNNSRNTDGLSSSESSGNSLVREVGFEPTKAYTTGA